ncbi:MAG: glycosyltransferase family 2 protein [Opitutaceae bacterium]|nr:glycosyltransferase family 2 protein [Opitutaceae bacterium]
MPDSRSNEESVLRDSVMVVIPALDEELTIGPVVDSLIEQGFSCIRVVDNGSRDKTGEVARKAGAVVMTETVSGYGRACWRACEKLPETIEWILFCDGDGSDRLDELDSFLDVARRADFVLGNRRHSKEVRTSMTLVQNFGNGLATFLMQVGWSYRYGDLGPLRLIRRHLFEEIQMEDRGFGWTIEMQVRAVELKARIVELPVGYRVRQGGRSKISGTIRGSVQAGSIILSTLAKFWIRKMKRKFRGI